MPVPTSAVKVNPVTGALIDPPVATFAAANGLLTGGSSDAKNSVRLATTGAITLASRTSSTLTTAASTLTTDGSAVANGDRLLVKNAPSGGGGSSADCGIYDVSGVGTTVVLTRSSDFDAWTEIVGAFVSVEAGTVNAGTQWLCNVVAGGTLGTTAITFVVPKNYVDLTTAQSVTGTKTFSSVVLTTAAITNATVGTSLTITDSGQLVPENDGGASLGASGSAFVAVYLSDDGGLDFGDGAAVLIHNAGVLTLAPGDFRVTTAGTNAASVATLAGTQTLTNKTISGASNTISNVSLTTGVTGTLPVGKGGTGLTAGTSGGILAFTATGTIASSGLLAANALMIGGGAGVAPSTTTTGAGVLVANINRPIFATTATAAGTTALTVTSAATQEFTGSTTQTVTNPVVTTLVAGWATTFINKSTGNVTLNSSGGNAIVVLAGGQSVTLVCRSISADTTAAAWDVVGLAPRLWVARNAASDTTLPNSTWTLLTFATTNGGNMAGSMTSTIFTAFKAGNIKISFAGLFYGQVTLGDDIAEFGLRVQKNAEAVATSALMMTDLKGADSNSRFNGWYNPSIVLSCAAGDTFKIYGYYDNAGDDGEADDYSAVVEYLDA